MDAWANCLSLRSDYYSLWGKISRGISKKVNSINNSVVNTPCKNGKSTTIDQRCLITISKSRLFYPVLHIIFYYYFLASCCYNNIIRNISGAQPSVTITILLRALCSDFISRRLLSFGLWLEKIYNKEKKMAVSRAILK